MSQPQPDSDSSSTPSTPASAESDAPELVVRMPVSQEESSSTNQAGAARSTAAPVQAPARPRRSQRILIAGLVVALVVCGGMLVAEKQETGQLRSTVSGLTAELEVTQTALVAHEHRLTQIRGQVGDIASRVGLLQDLVGEGESEAAAVTQDSSVSTETAVSPALVPEERGENLPPADVAPAIRVPSAKVESPVVQPYLGLGSGFDDDLGFGDPWVPELDAPPIY